ncbi:hypothetical protein ONV78_28125 [Hahella sp. CR1]|uniref:hypothetical protein n=1 Tax=Hahella sp. CR1 TaxID=2992807 RepID=UPI0024436F33|nr:hypothetical protein [Hahella sp. CR1]MDG9671636.1 hypothetical protein [Hahella sp. CR1]
MDLGTFNKTLSWLDEAVVVRFDCEAYDLALEVNSSSGGPGENVSAHIMFSGVCYLSIPMVMRALNCLQLKLCNFEQATKLLPVDDLDDGYELEIKEGIMKVLQFYDGDRELRHYVACYQYELQQSPESWSYDWL